MGKSEPRPKYQLLDKMRFELMNYTLKPERKSNDPTFENS